MQKIPLSLAQPDMVLEKPITRENGMILVGQGTALTDALIERLTNMEIQFIVVEGHPLDLDGQGAGTSFGKRRERVTHLFRNMGDDPFMGKMKLFLDDYFVRKGAMAQAAAAAAEEEGGE